ncbi:MAG TPA: VWA domain-containing protein [Terriglobia bacterium]|nr:VWA domain-containing protein [Terriglobia bacterium]
MVKLSRHTPPLRSSGLVFACLALAAGTAIENSGAHAVAEAAPYQAAETAVRTEPHQPSPATHETQPPSSSNVIRVQVKQVLVPVVVTDRKGHHITGLKANNFVVLEDGVPQKLVAFSTEQDGAASLFTPESTPASPASAPAPDTAALVRRNYLICLDTLNSSFGDFTQVREALQKLFRQERGADSQYALIALGRQPAVIQNLTRDPAAILQALESKELLKSIQSSEDGNLSYQFGELTRILADYCQLCPCSGAPAATGRNSTGSAPLCAAKWQTVQMWANSAAQQRDNFTRSFLRDLRETVRQEGRLPGKRVLVLVSDGFNLQPGRDLYGVMAAYTNNPTELLLSPTSNLETEIQDIVRLASDHDVTFYTLDSRGLQATPAGGLDASQEVYQIRNPALLPQVEQDRRTVAVENQSAMNELAQATGGVFYHDSNDLLKGLRQSFADGRDYYVLAYAPTNAAADGRFREIKVEVNGKNLVVRAKRGYWAAAN